SFQAEDGIRDFHVTGVQTCALPIWRSAFSPQPPSRKRHAPRTADGSGAPGGGTGAAGARRAGRAPPSRPGLRRAAAGPPGQGGRVRRCPPPLPRRRSRLAGMSGTASRRPARLREPAAPSLPDRPRPAALPGDDIADDAVRTALEYGALDLSARRAEDPVVEACRFDRTRLAGLALRRGEVSDAEFRGADLAGARF